MNSFFPRNRSTGLRFILASVFGLLTAGLVTARPLSDYTQGNITADFSQAAPRTVEELTKRSVMRDYGRAWDSLAAALSSNAPELLNAYFTGTAKSTSADT